jgi:glycosyltransferase involved in cell wall biosynthesis
MTPGTIGVATHGHDIGAQRPRVLHVLGSLGKGGIETWLMHMLRHRHRFEVQHELLLTGRQVGAYEAEALRLGIRIHKIPLRDGRLAWFAKFRKLLLEEGPFLTVHSHDEPAFSALVLAAAKSTGVSSRIAHSHSARSGGADYPLVRKVARLVAIRLIRRVATRCLGTSEDALVEVAGRDWRRSNKASILICGFDFSQFTKAQERASALRVRLGVPQSARIVGNVARFVPVKNHRLLIDAYEHCRDEVPEAHLVLVGAGPLRPELEARVRERGLGDVVHFVGTTDDVPSFMAMFDLFVLPSYSEGLGIVCVEAQAAGTPLLASDMVPSEAFVVREAVETLPPDADETVWGAAMARLLRVPNRSPPGQWLRQVEHGRFGIERCIAELNALYRAERELAD